MKPGHLPPPGAHAFLPGIACILVGASSGLRESECRYWSLAGSQALAVGKMLMPAIILCDSPSGPGQDAK